MDRKRPKIRVDFQINGVCNARCDFCKIWENPIYNEKILPAEHWIRTARDLKRFSDVEHVCIGGGEPFMYKDLYAVIRGIRELGIIVSIVTNGSLLSEKNCERLIEAGISHIDFSIDSFAEKHNRMRGIPDLFEKCVKAINYLKELKPELSIGISAIILEDNIYDIPEFVEWITEKLPINYIHFQAYNQVLTHNGGKQWWKNDPLWPKDREVIIQVMKYLKRRKLEGAKISNPASQFDKYIQYFLNPEADLEIKCPAGTNNFAVSYTGDVHGCIKEMPAGNIIRDSPMEIYYGDFSHARKKASTCKENCHFLVNCLYDVQERKKELGKKPLTRLIEIIQKHI
ncbi:TPA: radical SAM protein [Candidatus Woesearchaeota archaeon]|nr:Glycosyl transferase family 2 [archaeon GW2011_AR15]MBS3104511.1 radical SAM protein [Candidatus Woesearchaeota archaeon]HIH41175.1 radical SAM protein [Candidatus Woesearchaeota archaeon]